MTDGLIESFTSTKNIKLKYIYIIYYIYIASAKQKADHFVLRDNLFSVKQPTQKQLLTGNYYQFV